MAVRASAENWGRAGNHHDHPLVRRRRESEAWEPLGSMRGLRAPGRLQAVDPMVLRTALTPWTARGSGQVHHASTVEDLIMTTPAGDRDRPRIRGRPVASTNPDRTWKWSRKRSCRTKGISRRIDGYCRSLLWLPEDGDAKGE